MNTYLVTIANFDDLPSEDRVKIIKTAREATGLGLRDTLDACKAGSFLVARWERNAAALDRLAAFCFVNVRPNQAQRVTIDSKGLPFFDENGEWVSARDYAELHAQLEQLRERVRFATEHLNRE